MTFDEYQKLAGVTAVYPRQGDNPVYPTLGLVGEAGEIAEKVKKIIRDDNCVISDEKRKELIKELGDVLWYLAALSTELGASLETVAQQNIDKLKSRQERNKLQGSGDNR